MRLRGLLAGVVVLVVLVCTSPASAEREWAVTLLGGQYSGNKLLDFPDAFDFKDSYATGLSVSYQFVDWGPHMRWELEGQVLKHFGEQEHVELAASINVRWITFPWNRYLDTSFAFGGGLSQATEVPVLERRDPDSSEASALLHYLMVEAAFGLPGSPWSVVARLHHRSGVFGLFSHSGSNLVEFGLRYRF